MGIKAWLSLQVATTLPLAGELAWAGTYCVSSNSADLEPVTCCAVQLRSGQVGESKYKERKCKNIKATAVPALFNGCFDTTRVVASSALLNSSLSEPLWSSSVLIFCSSAVHIVSFRQIIFINSLIWRFCAVPLNTKNHYFSLLEYCGCLQ